MCWSISIQPMAPQRGSPGVDPANGGAEVGCLGSIWSTTSRRRLDLDLDADDVHKLAGFQSRVQHCGGIPSSCVPEAMLVLHTTWEHAS